MSTDVPAASPWPLPISRSRAARSATAPPLPARDPQPGPDRALPPAHPEAPGLPSR